MTRILSISGGTLLVRNLHRAERSGKGDGRVYVITFEASDSSGNITETSTSVTIPHSQ